jgi:ATP-dependent helicase/nuclease subunit A
LFDQPDGVDRPDEASGSSPSERHDAAQPATVAPAQLANEPADWRTVALRPGALFVVGDPKQSIYRFRRADIDVYNDVRNRLAGGDGSGVVPLTTNFRSVPRLCEWANDLFKDRFPPGPTAVAPKFDPLIAYRSAAGDSAAAADEPSLAVIDLAGTIDVTLVAAEEADRIARYICSEVAAGRRTYGDFLILTRRKKGLRPYAEALEARGVPIEVTGAGAFGDSAEVREISLLLLALADPQDAVALVGVLRGALFGLSDRDLFAFRDAGGYFNLFAEIDAADAAAERVVRALDTLRRWHKWTRMLPGCSTTPAIWRLPPLRAAAWKPAI